MNIHPLAVVSPQAQLGRGVRIGPFAVIEDDVIVGDDCTVAGHAVLKNGTRLGPNNTICESAVVGGQPQHVRCPSETGQVVIGQGNTIREFATVHRAMKPDAATTIGDGNYLMAGAHVAHDCAIGNQTILANNTLLAGHVVVADRAFVSGCVAVHQFCRIGTMAMVGGHARITRDVPPFVTVDGSTGDVVGLNIVGLKRNGYSSDQIAVLKEAYRLIYRSGLSWKEMVARLEVEFSTGPAGPMVQFFNGGSRGFVQERRAPAAVTLKLRKDQDEPETAPQPAAAPQPSALTIIPAPLMPQELKAKAG